MFGRQTQQFKILNPTLGGKEGITTLVYDLNRSTPQRVFRNVQLDKPSSSALAVETALKLSRKRRSDVIMEFLPYWALEE